MRSTFAGSCPVSAEAPLHLVSPSPPAPGTLSTTLHTPSHEHECPQLYPAGEREEIDHECTQGRGGGGGGALGTRLVLVLPVTQAGVRRTGYEANSYLEVCESSFQFLYL